MSNNDQDVQRAQAAQHLRRVMTLGALTLALAHLLFPSLASDGITLALLAISVIPWLAPIFKSLELPGGWKVEFQELEKAAIRAEQAGLLAASEPPQPEYAFQRASQQDPNLALAGLRIEIEKRLAAIAERHGIDPRQRGIGQLLRELAARNALTADERSVLADLTGLLNSAVHGAAVDNRAAYWAISVGPRLLKGLDDLRDRAR